MALPRQVEKQLKEIESIEKQMQAPAPDGGQTADVTTDPPADPTNADMPKTEPSAPVVPEETWEHKYHRLQGKYDNEVPRLHQQNRDLQSQLTELQRQVTELQKAKPADEPKQRQALVTDQDEATYGSDLIDLQRRVAREVAAEFQAAIDTLREENAALKERVAKTDNAVGEVTFEARLARAIPDFDAINDDTRWIAWLDEFVPDLRGTRRPLLQECYNRGDVAALAEYVALWRKSITPAKPDQRKSEVERQVTPSRASSASSQAPAAKIYTAAEVDTLFTRVRNLNIAGKFDEANKLEAEIGLAYQEGRVR